MNLWMPPEKRKKTQYTFQRAYSWSNYKDWRWLPEHDNVSLKKARELKAKYKQSEPTTKTRILKTEVKQTVVR